VQHLRQDALALALSLANIGAHARVLVVDSCAGLVTGAVAERLGGYGVVS
jgi:tRNA (adenine-N(1)-)-methyltransferase non-catalytic subunit